MEVAAWREREAQARDVPRGRVLKDDALIDIAVCGAAQRRGARPPALDPDRLRALARRRRHSRGGRARRSSVTRRACRCPSAPRAAAPATGATVELLKVLLKAVAEEEGVAAEDIATVDDLEAIAETTRPTCPPLHGWRRDCSATRRWR